MPAKDIYHTTVCDALVKDGWTITHDPYTMTFGQKDVFVDLGAERLLAAEKGSESPSRARSLSTRLISEIGISHSSDAACAKASNSVSGPVSMMSRSCKAARRSISLEGGRGFVMSPFLKIVISTAKTCGRKIKKTSFWSVSAISNFREM